MLTWFRSRRRPRVMVAKQTFIVRDAFGRGVFYVYAGQCFVSTHRLVKAHPRNFRREARKNDAQQQG
jgi:hypothetical protein